MGSSWMCRPLDLNKRPVFLAPSSFNFHVAEAPRLHVMAARYELSVSPPSYATLGKTARHVPHSSQHQHVAKNARSICRIGCHPLAAFVTSFGSHDFLRISHSA